MTGAVSRTSPASEELFGNLFDRLPKEMIFVRQLLLSALFRSPEHWQFDSDNGAG